MKLLLSTLCFTLLSFNPASYALVDPDSLDPSMPVVSYLIPATDLNIAAYKHGLPSHLKVILCDVCLEKTYLLSSDAILESSRQPLDKSKLTASLLKKDFSQIRLGVDRVKSEIIYLHLGASADDESAPQQSYSLGVKK